MALVTVDTEKITVAAAAIGFTAAKITTQVLMALVTVETAAVRINAKNTPVAGGAEGSHLANPGDEFEVWGYGDLKNFRAIREGATSGVLMVSFQGAGTT